MPSPRRLNQTQLILRLNDLPAGYLKLDLQEDAGGRGLLRRAVPRRGHSAEGREARRPLPPEGLRRRPTTGSSRHRGQPAGAAVVVGTGVLAIGSDAAADAAWDAVARTPRPAERAAGSCSPVKSADEIGTATKLFHAREHAALLPGLPQGRRTSRPSSSGAQGTRWRRSCVIGDCLCGHRRCRRSSSPASSRRTFEHRPDTPLAERFDGEVPLDDPAIDVPVYWLGRNFRPGARPARKPALRVPDLSGEASPESFSIGFAERPRRSPQHPLRKHLADTWTPATRSAHPLQDQQSAITSWKCYAMPSADRLPRSERRRSVGGYKKHCQTMPRGAEPAWVERR